MTALTLTTIVPWLFAVAFVCTLLHVRYSCIEARKRLSHLPWLNLEKDTTLGVLQARLSNLKALGKTCADAYNLVRPANQYPIACADPKCSTVAGARHV